MRLIKKITVPCAVLALLCPVAAPAAEQFVLSGVPATKVESSSDKTSKFVLSEDQKREFRLLIVKRDGKYLWASREYKPLVHTISGAFHYFIEPNGSGYIKVVDRRLFLEEKCPQYLYMEHLILWLKTITYWGAAEEFNL